MKDKANRVEQVQRERRRIQVSAEEIGPLCLEKVPFAVAVAGSV